MSSSYEFWIPSNQNTSSSALTTTGPGGVEYIGDPEHLSNSNELIFGNAIKTQMGNTVNSYMGGYMANYTPYYIATILGTYQQTIMGLKSELVYGYKWEYKGTGKVEYNSASELSQKLGATTLLNSAYNSIASMFTRTVEDDDEDIVFGVRNAVYSDHNIEVLTQVLTGESEDVDIVTREAAYVESNTQAESWNLTALSVMIDCPAITATSALIVLG
jgi:hypothetical protein